MSLPRGWVRDFLLAMTTASTVIASVMAYTYSQPVVVVKDVKMWSHLVDPFGRTVAPPAQVRWDVDAASCGPTLDTLVEGMHHAEGIWRGLSSTDIQRAQPDDRINLAVYCVPFGEKYSQSPRAYRIRYLETEPDATLRRIAVEVPSNWAVVETASREELDKVTWAQWSAHGTAYYAIGLALGAKHAYAAGKNTLFPPLDDSQRARTCVKRCDP